MGQWPSYCIAAFFLSRFFFISKICLVFSNHLKQLIMKGNQSNYQGFLLHIMLVLQFIREIVTIVKTWYKYLNCMYFFCKKEIHLLRTIGLLLSYRSILYNTNICTLLVMIIYTDSAILYFFSSNRSLENGLVMPPCWFHVHKWAVQ